MSSDAEVGWIAAIIIGGIAGWLAEQFMKSDMGLLMNIVLGIVGAAIASAILSIFGIVLGGWIGYLILGFIGACLLIWIVRMVRGTRTDLRTCAAMMPAGANPRPTSRSRTKSAAGSSSKGGDDRARPSRFRLARRSTRGRSETRPISSRARQAIPTPGGR